MRRWASACRSAPGRDGALPAKSCRAQVRSYEFGPCSRQRGFTLIEVVVAFALLALALTLLLGTLTRSAREVRLSADGARAALHAQSLLDQTGVGESLQPGTRDGAFEDGRYRWTLRIEPYVDPQRPPNATFDPSAARLLQLALVMQWGDGGSRQRLQLRTLRLVQPDALQGSAP